jgi:hypothetical protein
LRHYPRPHRYACAAGQDNGRYRGTAVTANDVKQRVLSEVGDRTTNRFGWNFRHFLLPEPELRDYGGELLWTILVERDAGEGYHVIFDAEMDKFGLAHGGACVGLYGGFLEAVDAM